MRNIVVAALVLSLASLGHAAQRSQGPMTEFFHWKPAENAGGGLSSFQGPAGFAYSKTIATIMT